MKQYFYKNKKLKLLLIILGVFCFSITFAQCNKNESETVSTDVITESSTDKTASSNSSETTEENQEFLNILEDVKKEFGENIVEAQDYFDKNNFKIETYYFRKDPEPLELAAFQGSINSDFLFLYHADFLSSCSIKNLSLNYYANTDNLKNEVTNFVKKFEEKLNNTGITASRNGTELKWESGEKYICIDDWGKDAGNYKLTFSFLSEEDEKNEKNISEDLREKAEEHYKKYLDGEHYKKNLDVSIQDSVMCHEITNILENYKNITPDELKNKLASENINFTENEENNKITYEVSDISNITDLSIKYSFIVKDNNLSYVVISCCFDDENILYYLTTEFHTVLKLLSDYYGPYVEGEGYYYFDNSNISTNSRQVSIILNK